MRRIKTGDSVIVITGNDKGKKGKVLSFVGDRVIVEGVNLHKKFIKKNVMGQNQDGTMVEVESSLHISNVQLIDPKSGKPTKISYMIEKGKKTRIARKSGLEILPEKEEKKVAKKTVTKKKAVKKTADKAKKKVVKKVAKSTKKKNENS